MYFYQTSPISVEEFPWTYNLPLNPTGWFTWIQKEDGLKTTTYNPTMDTTSGDVFTNSTISLDQVEFRSLLKENQDDLSDPIPSNSTKATMVPLVYISTLTCKYD